MEGCILDEGELVAIYERWSYSSMVLHEETDLGALNAELAWVGREPMQPAHVSLRLRPATSPKYGGGRGYQIDEWAQQTYAFFFRCLSEWRKSCQQ
jgi:hypothetical protein